MRKLPVVFLTCSFAAFGCSSGNHFMSEALEKRSPAELTRIEVRTNANPNALIRSPQSAPYIIDGKDEKGVKKKKGSKKEKREKRVKYGVEQL